MTSIVVSFFFVVLANILVWFIPALFQRGVDGAITKNLTTLSDDQRRLAGPIVLNSMDFAASVSAIFIVSMSIALELWKLVVRDHDVAIVLLALVIIVPPATAYILRLRWAKPSASQYNRGIGRALKAVVLVLSAILLCIPLIGDSLPVEGQAPATNENRRS